MCIQELTQPLGKDLKKKSQVSKKRLIKRDSKIIDSLNWWNNLTTEEREKKILILYNRRRKNEI